MDCNVKPGGALAKMVCRVAGGPCYACCADAVLVQHQLVFGRRCQCKRCTRIVDSFLLGSETLSMQCSVMWGMCKMACILLGFCLIYGDASQSGEDCQCFPQANTMEHHRRVRASNGHVFECIHLLHSATAGHHSGAARAGHGAVPHRQETEQPNLLFHRCFNSQLEASHFFTVDFCLFDFLSSKESSARLAGPWGFSSSTD